MSGVPNLCVDIFSQMSNLLHTFNANISQGSETFTHDGGFQVGQTPQGGEPTSIEDSVNEYASWAFIGMMALFLVF